MLDLIFPRADYAEDQEYARTVLISHVLHRSLNAGGALGLGHIGVSTLWHRWKGTSSSTPFLVSISKTSLWTTAFVSAALAARMYGKEHIEWQDRAWRLLGHPTQRAVDQWSGLGAAAGAMTGTILLDKGSGPYLARGLGGAAIGSVVGIVALEAYRSVQGTRIGSSEVK